MAKARRTRALPKTKALSRELVLSEAITLADKRGLSALSMRKLAEALGIEAMSLYHYVKNKDALLDGMVDLVFAEIERPTRGKWKSKMRKRCESLREVLLAHSWATALLDSHALDGPNKLDHHEWCVSTLLKAGFDVPNAGHAFTLLDSFVYGFVIQELALPMNPGEPMNEESIDITGGIDPERYPSLSAMGASYLESGYVFSEEFSFGLQLILKGLEARL